MTLKSSTLCCLEKIILIIFYSSCGRQLQRLGVAVLPTKVTSVANSVLSGSADLAANISKNGEMVVTAFKGSREIFHLKRIWLLRMYVNIGDQKHFKLRIKMGYDSILCIQNTAIYNRLALEISLFLLLENSLMMAGNSHLEMNPYCLHHLSSKCFPLSSLLDRVMFHLISFVESKYRL